MSATAIVTKNFAANLCTVSLIRLGRELKAQLQRELYLARTAVGARDAARSLNVRGHIGQPELRVIEEIDRKSVV